MPAHNEGQVTVASHGRYTSRLLFRGGQDSGGSRLETLCVLPRYLGDGDEALVQAQELDTLTAGAAGTARARAALDFDGSQIGADVNAG